MSDPHSDSTRPFGWLTVWLRREIDRERRRWRRSVRIVFIVAIVLLVLRVVSNIWIGYELNREVARLEKTYGSLRLINVPYVPQGQNRARLVHAAMDLLVIGNREAATIARLATRPGGVRQAALTAKDTDDLRELVDVNAQAIEIAQQSRQRPTSNWEVDYPSDGNFPHLLEIRRLGTVVAAGCRVEMLGGRPDRALDRVVAGMAVSGSLRQEPILIIQLIRLAVANEQFRCLRDVLEGSEPSSAALSNLAGVLAENRVTDGPGVGLVGEMKSVHYRLLQAEANVSGRSVSPAWSGPVSWILRPLIRYGHLRALRAIARIIDTQSRPPFERAAEPAQRPWPAWWHPLKRWDELGTSGLVRSAQRGYEYRSVLNAAELSVALRRYRLDRGGYPDTLAALAPQYLPQVPTDPFTGRAPDYTRQGAGFDLRVHGAPQTESTLLDWRSPR